MHKSPYDLHKQSKHISVLVVTFCELHTFLNESFLDKIFVKRKGADVIG